MSALATEGGHWYAKDGSPVYEVPRAKPGKNGETHRAATLKDARQLQLARGCTSILKQKAAPNLTRYFLRQRAEACYTAPKEIAGLPFEEWLARIEQDEQEHAKQARERGTEGHAGIELGIRGERVPEHLVPWYAAFEKACVQEFGWLPGFSAEHSFASRYGYGCKLDAIATAPGIIIDHKGCDMNGRSLTLYDEHLMQLAAQREAARAAGARCFIGFFDRTTPRYVLVEADELSLRRGWEMFRCCLRLQQLEDGYVPDWAVAA